MRFPCIFREARALVSRVLYVRAVNLINKVDFPNCPMVVKPFVEWQWVFVMEKYHGIDIQYLYFCRVLGKSHLVDGVLDNMRLWEFDLPVLKSIDIYAYIVTIIYFAFNV